MTNKLKRIIVATSIALALMLNATPIIATTIKDYQKEMNFIMQNIKHNETNLRDILNHNKHTAPILTVDETKLNGEIKMLPNYTNNHYTQKAWTK